MMQKRTIHFGIIGCGLMGREFGSAVARWCHLLDQDTIPRIVGVCDTNPAMLDWFTSSFDSIQIATRDYTELLNSPDIEAIYCAVPHHLHEQLYVDIIEAGKHLLGEKPFGIDQAANTHIMAAAQAHPAILVRGSSEFPFFPGAQQMLQFIREERFGTILEVQAGFLHSSDLDPHKPINWKRRVATNGEYGCMGDLGMHVLHIPLRVGWFPRNVRALLSKIVKERPGPGGTMVPCEPWPILPEARRPGSRRTSALCRPIRPSPAAFSSLASPMRSCKCGPPFATSLLTPAVCARISPA